MNFGLDNFCPITDDTDELLKKASTIDTSSFSISEQISEIKIYLQKPSCENRKLAEKQLDTLEEINKYYEIYKNETFTKKTNVELKKLFKAIDKNKYIGDFNGLSEKIDLRLNSELTRLRDTYIFENDTFRDNVEKNINFMGEYFNGTYNETEEINLFLKYFTVEYINFLDFNKITYPGLESSKIILNPNDLTKVLNKVKFRMKNIDYDFELKINLKEGLEKAVNLKNISQKVKIVKRSEKKQDSDKKIKKAEKNTQINLEFNNILEENIIEKINKYTEYLYKNPTLKKYYKTSVIGIYPKISRADYVRKIFSEINNVEGGVEDIPKGIKEEFLKIISGLPAQESKYDNSALNPNSGAFGIFQFTNINLIDSIKSGRLSKCPFLNIEEINQINILIKLDKSKIQENPLFKKLKKTFKSSMKKITWASASYFKVLYRKLTKITKGEHSSFITTDRKILSDLIERYNLSEKEKNKFIVYMMVNGYNTGGERINILLSEFSKNNEPKYNKNTALSLLEEITTFGKKQKASLTDYDKDSSEYVWKIIAGNKAVEKLEVEEKNTKKVLGKINIYNEKDKSLKEHWDKIPEEIKISSKRFSDASLINLKKFILDKKEIKNGHFYNGNAQRYCARGVKDFLREYKIRKSNFGTHAYPGMNNYLEKNSISLEEYKKNGNLKGKVFLKVPLDFPEEAYPGGIVSYKNLESEPNLEGSNARKRYGHIEIITRDSKNKKIYKHYRNIVGKETHKNFRVLYDGFTIVTSGSTFNTLIRKWNITGNSHQEKLIKASDILRKKGIKEYQKTTGFTGYVYYIF